MQRFLNTTHRSVVWFKKAADAGELEISPPYQRNPVWSPRQQAALIVTILLEFPIPEVYMQDVTTDDGAQKHILVDGQQRIRAALGYVNNEFELDDESDRWAGLMFDDLSPEDRRKIFEYSFVVRLLPEMPNEEVRVIFQRINRNTTTLNPQELRRATYWGPFITLMEELSNAEFWNEAGIFSANDRRRMLDVEYVSELAVAVLNGPQNKKKLLEEFYQQYETQFEHAERLRDTFTIVLGEIRHLVPDIRQTRWKKKSDFYTLFVLLAKHVAQLPLSAERRTEAETILAAFGTTVELHLDLGLVEPPQHIVDYARNVERAASDLGSRRERERVLDELLAPVFAAPAVPA
jgi:hypothetical protein